MNGMDSNIIIALLSLAGTAMGTLGGIMASSRLTNHRLCELEKRVDRHNNLVVRMVEIEQRAKSNSHRLDEAGI